jgi:hypothetical protein
MAITKTLTFSGLSINNVDYSLHLQENAEISIEPVTDLIDDGQTLPSAYDVSFSVDVYSNTLLADSNVYSDASQDPVKTWIRFNGISGGQTLNVTNIIVNGNRKFDQNRLAVTLSGTKRVTNVETAIIES